MHPADAHVMLLVTDARHVPVIRACFCTRPVHPPQTLPLQRPLEARPWMWILHSLHPQSGVGRQGAVSKHRNSLQKEPMPCRPMPLLVQLRHKMAVRLAAGGKELVVYLSLGVIIAAFI